MRLQFNKVNRTERFNEKQPASQVGEKKNQYQVNHFLFPVWFIDLFTRDQPGARGLELGEERAITAHHRYHLTLYRCARDRTALPPS